MPWDQALDIILQTKGLDMRKNGNIVLIAPREELALKEKQQLESQAQINDLEPLQTEMFQLNYAKAADILNIVNVGGRAPRAGRRGARIPVQARHGVRRSAHQHPVRARTSRARLEEVRRVIRQIDTAVRQVLIEARIVIADDKFSRQLGVRLRPADRRDAVQPPLRVRQRRLAVDARRSSHRRHGGTATPRHAHADAVRARVGHRVGRLLGLAAAQRQPAGVANAGRASSR